MNKHLLETKIKSIAHYNSEIIKLDEAMKVTRSTINDIVSSLSEYITWEHGDILQRQTDGYLFRFIRVIAPIERDGVISFDLELQQPDYRDYRQQWRITTTGGTRILLTDIEKYKVITNIE